MRDGAGRRSNKRNISVIALAPLPSLNAAQPGALPAVFAGDGMWIWYVDKSEGGNLDAIAARAKAAGMSTVFVKSADGGDVWEQFTPQLVADLHARGLRACAWQFVYGADPQAEASAAAASIAAGADCFVIDAETKYEGRYASAQRYIAALRGAIGPSYPLGFTSFPYVDYHPRLPYSVFLGPGGAQANLPQVYWKAIGGSVDAVSAKTVAQNRIYGTPIAPLGQSYDAPKAGDLRRFRALWAGYGAGGLSWWSWQATQAPAWAVLTEPAPAPVVPSDPGWPALDQGSTGDQVIWLQQHLASADPSVALDGKFTAATKAALQAFQIVARAGGDGRDGRGDVAGAADACRCASWTGPLAVAVGGLGRPGRARGRRTSSAARKGLSRLDAPPATRRLGAVCRICIAGRYAWRHTPPLPPASTTARLRAERRVIRTPSSAMLFARGPHPEPASPPAAPPATRPPPPAAPRPTISSPSAAPARARASSYASDSGRRPDPRVSGRSTASATTSATAPSATSASPAARPPRTRSPSPVTATANTATTSSA